MNILILTQYFPPEVGAPQNRLLELAVRLKARGAKISILTAMPNYPQMKIHDAYRGKFYCAEEFEGLKVHRSYIFVKNSKSIFFRLLNYFSFVISSFLIGWLKLKKFDIIICESPPLFLGISAYLLKKIKGGKLIFNVSDLWPESAEKLGLVTNRFFLNISTKLEEFLYRKSEIISGQTQGIIENISSRFPNKMVYWLKNGVDPELFNSEKIESSWREDHTFDKDDFIVLYAGIIGHAQGLEVILKAASRLLEYYRIKFILLGSGPVKKSLLDMKRELKLNNVYFFDAVTKQEMPNVLKSINVSVIPLKKLDLFKGAIPSKIFEVLAMKKPILLGVDGEARELFIEEGRCGLFFTPEDDKDLSLKIITLYNSPTKSIRFGENGYKFINEKFNLNTIAENFWNNIIIFENKNGSR